MVIRGEPRLRELCRAYFGKWTPSMSARRGVVNVEYTWFPTGDWLYRRSERPAEVTLNSSLPWDIEVRGGASRLVADLRSAGYGDTTDRYDITITGGANNLSVERPRREERGEP